ncbi:hypothetical protein PHYBLDRAFT_72950 [Phycomyces blakesleeanus NRRL 1555(-)]|uniref:Uncharacterized protein n=1 Tax=Phycomyces blakesleeanus (strain ATCC 8743b / DSM 1359 / FGSC 10004 / NBRC 33097 / NRRL 1555) TaxID=763407 RepID=A0A162YJI9_PHYB8|nr:hypothetical protein PHYBLDRAFT_72950 [Phycomyces blakesleeanus NRRL 1555(-)]OAD81125.1 hypothetical protein PHYBLDRAFT_72950 [Phycomyces blakesleeanus NRRL 1555(-)]|eukprot:XP_018299165.1 hypothetical protein PHYBLDRAFT_72950 [Phycomyces blakesleeanus NRRL 1555(-)]
MSSDSGGEEQEKNYIADGWACFRAKRSLSLLIPFSIENAGSATATTTTINNKVKAPGWDMIETLFNYLVSQLRDICKYLFTMNTDKMLLNVTTCCALHSPYIDNCDTITVNTDNETEIRAVLEGDENDKTDLPVEPFSKDDRHQQNHSKMNSLTKSCLNANYR